MPSSAGRIAGDSARRRLLLADDHQIIRRGLRTLLERDPSVEVVAEAADGREALELAKACSPEIAIVDYSLPSLNGLNLVEELKRALPAIEVMVYTMHDREDLIFEVMRAGARGFVLKTDPEEEVLAAVRALATHHPYFSRSVSLAIVDRFLRIDEGVPRVLTQREREVVQLIAEGNTNKEVARSLDISVKTIETHRAAAMSKLNLRTTAQLVRYAVRNGIVEP